MNAACELVDEKLQGDRDKAEKKAEYTKKIFAVDCEFDVAMLEDPDLKMIKKDIDLQLEWHRFNGDKHVPKKNELPNRPEKLAALIAAVKRYNMRELSGESGADVPVIEPILHNNVIFLMTGRWTRNSVFIILGMTYIISRLYTNLVLLTSCVNILKHTYHAQFGRVGCLRKV